jgi:hypothetical protein
MELFIPRNQNWALIAVSAAPAARKAYPRKSGLSLWRVPPYPSIAANSLALT